MLCSRDPKLAWPGTQELPQDGGYIQDLTRSDFECNRLWVLKKSLNGTPFHLRACAAGFLIFVRLSCGGQNRCCRLTEEAHQSLDVLSYRC